MVWSLKKGTNSVDGIIFLKYVERNFRYFSFSLS